MQKNCSHQETQKVKMKLIKGTLPIQIEFYPYKLDKPVFLPFELSRP